jgi:MoxR-like ATPase
LSTPDTESAGAAVLERFSGSVQSIRSALGKVVLHQGEAVDLLLISCLSDGHSLLVGVPGLAKTLLVKTLAELFTWKFQRIQFTPDLMPADITGYELLAGVSGAPAAGHDVALAFRPGPIFANLVLADEINRAPPKTQAALLEAMQERQVTVGGKSHLLKPPFLVVATQNPIEQEGTYPLPEAQLDRFFMEIRIGYPPPAAEEEIVGLTTGEGLPRPTPILSREDFLALQELVRKVPAPRSVVRYAVALAGATRSSVAGANDLARTYIEWGAGPRAAQSLVLGAKARAVIAGRPAPVPADVEALALPVLRHRVIPNYRAVGEGLTSETIIRKLLPMVPKPHEER